MGANPYAVEGAVLTLDQSITLRHTLDRLEQTRAALRYDPARDSAVAYAAAAGRDPNFQPDFIETPAIDRRRLSCVYGGEAW